MKAIGRLLWLELYQFVSRRFFAVSVGIILTMTPLIAWIKILIPQESPVTDYGSLHALHVFAMGAPVGLTLATYLVVIFASMSFAGEFDHGTIKNILVRPVLRRDVFWAKCVMAVGVLIFFQLLALYAALLLGTFVGDLGPVWSQDRYIIIAPLDQLTASAWKAVAVAFPAGLAAVGIGLGISMLTESSGWTVAAALVTMLLLDLAAAARPPMVTLNFFFYPQYAFDVFGSISQGSSHKFWDPSKLSVAIGSWQAPRYLIFPAMTAAVAVGLAYPVFRFKDIKA